MSGPKCSRYTLTTEQHRILEKQVTIRRNESVLKRIFIQLQAHAAFFAEHKGREEAPPEFEETLASVRRVLLEAMPTDAVRLDAALKESETTVKKASCLLASLEAEKKNRVAQVNNSVAHDIEQGHGSTLDEVLKERSLTREKCEGILRTIEAEAVDPRTSLVAGVRMIQLRQLNQSALEGFYSSTIMPLKRRHLNEVRQFNAEKEDFAVLCQRYATVCEELEHKYIEYDWSPTAKKEMEDILAAFERERLRMAQEEYIRDAVDDVMQHELGYQLIGNCSVAKRSGTRLKHALYRFGDGTAIDVTFANGQIAMEVGGLANEDRLPQEDEVEKLCLTMEEFCTEFPRIEKQLRDRGVIVEQRIHHAPPTAAYAQMINLSDYALTDGVGENSDASTRVCSETAYMEVQSDE